ncbi:hypothetical protein [Olleya sp. R77988]|uniref:hypothetical protein n=1 Tax=Olleya sp. R77988 TaxID=3093875 RepID=UPI0037C8C6D6
MKKTLLVLLTLTLFSFSPTQNKYNLIGKWIGEDKNDSFIVIFENDGYAEFQMNGEILGGKEFVMNGKKGKMTYTINYETSPIELDFKVTLLETGESRNLYGIAKFIDKNSIQLSIEYNSIRPTEFNNENSSILMRSDK